MLQKRIDFNSQPFGLAIAGEDMTKGSAVAVKVADGVLKAFLPTSEAEANSVKGFVTYRIEEAGRADKDFDVLKTGQRVVIYTLAKDDMWATSEFIDAVGVTADAELVVGHTVADKGKLRVKTGAEVTANRKGLVKVYSKSAAGVGYTDAMVDVIVL